MAQYIAMKSILPFLGQGQVPVLIGLNTSRAWDGSVEAAENEF